MRRKEQIMKKQKKQARWQQLIGRMAMNLGSAVRDLYGSYAGPADIFVSPQTTYEQRKQPKPHRKQR